ncbi:MAG: tripartite tricarboxylate transporter permease, partial [Nocardioidaceae bacterium]
RGTALGFPIGALPAGGSEIPTFLSYMIERRLSPRREEFGREGAIEGVAGPEAANNASFSGTLVPLLTLGIPTSATAAIMLAAFQIFNLQPGPELFEQNSELVWTLIASLYVGNIMLLALNLPLIRVWVKVLQVPRPVLYAAILVFATLGIYSVSGEPTDILIAYAIGVVAMFMRLHDFPIAPVVLGAILGPNLESQLRRALTASNGDWSTFVDHPRSAVILVLAVVAFVLPYVPRLLARARGDRTRTGKFAVGDED